ncbi:hypothetical protein [Ureibacillus manganicus]|nr:hypothetical protein [Ureibacillus manganicus]
MSFPIRDHEGYIMLGIFGSILFVIAMILLVIGLKKYHFRSVLLVAIIYSLLPNALIFIYQETFATGIYAVSYDQMGRCEFDTIDEDLKIMEGECQLELKNHSNKPVTFELEFLDSYIAKENRSESLMNVAGPFAITIEGNQKKLIDLKETLDVSTIPNHIHSGYSNNVHIKIIDNKASRILSGL